MSDPSDPDLSDPNPARSRGRRRRRLQLIAWWLVVGALLAALLGGGPWYLIIPLGVLGALVVANTAALVNHRGPEEQALSPGRLARATIAHDAVSVTATWAPRPRARDRQRHEGRLTWAGGRLTFTAQPTSTRREGAPRELVGLGLLDADPTELRLGSRPTLWHPDLVVVQGETTHVLDLRPGWDIASIGVGVLVADEWYRQLVEMGVTPS